MEMLVEIIGWTGMVLTLTAYALVSFNKITAQTIAYQSMNAAGGAGLAMNAWYYDALPSLLLETCWMLIGVGMLCKIALTRMQGVDAC